MISAMDPRSAARILDLADESARPRDSRSRAFAGFALILSLAAHGAATSGSPRSAQAAAMSPAGARQASKAQAGESPEMKQLMAIGVAAAVSAGASAQDAVQWRVEDGGNGHWYLPVYEFVSSPTAHAAAVARGGYLATFLSAQENAFIAALGLPFSNNGVIYSYWIGGIRSDSSSPWTWATGEPWTFSNFDIYEPNGCCGSDVRFLVMRAHPGSEGRWDDTSANGNWDGTPLPFIIEYSADCNADGLVDYGQIRAGQLVDANGNNIPDCCENGGSCCPGDTNNDQSVDGIDLATVLTRWGMPGAKYPQADCNDDGAIDGTDLAIVLAGWGGCA
jgi:hypothetical protein